VRAVVDPGVLIAAAISRTQDSATVELVRQWRHDRFELVASDRLVAEFAAVAQRSWFRERVSDRQADQLIADLRQRAILVDEPQHVRPVTRDPDDDYLVGLARSTAADALVSGDRDLTDLTLGDVRLLTPRAFLDQLADLG
jgi:putative PIN family toxin of toxin-antitoxin system